MGANIGSGVGVRAQSIVRKVCCCMGQEISKKSHWWLRYSLMRNLSPAVYAFSFSDIMAGADNRSRAARFKWSEVWRDCSTHLEIARASAWAWFMAAAADKATRQRALLWCHLIAIVVALRFSSHTFSIPSSAFHLMVLLHPLLCFPPLWSASAFIFSRAGSLGYAAAGMGA